MKSSRALLFFSTFSFVNFSKYSVINNILPLTECPAKQEMSCESLRTTEGYTYPVLLNIPGSRDCEHAWYLLVGTVCCLGYVKV